MPYCKGDDSQVCQECGALVADGYWTEHKAFHEQVTGLLLKVNGVCPSCKRPYDEPSCEAGDHSSALVERWDVMPFALRRGTPERQT